MISNATIADSLSPEELMAFAQSFGLETEQSDYLPEFMTPEWLEQKLGFCTSDYLWDAMWRFGIVVDNDTKLCAESLAGYWNPEGSLRSRAGYYVPCDYDTTIQTVSLDNPPRLLSIAEQEEQA